MVGWAFCAACCVLRAAFSGSGASGGFWPMSSQRSVGKGPTSVGVVWWLVSGLGGWFVGLLVCWFVGLLVGVRCATAVTEPGRGRRGSSSSTAESVGWPAATLLRVSRTLVCSGALGAMGGWLGGWLVGWNRVMFGKIWLIISGKIC